LNSALDANPTAQSPDQGSSASAPVSNSSPSKRSVN
jgi:hypothetical protein